MAALRQPPELHIDKAPVFEAVEDCHRVTALLSAGGCPVAAAQLAPHMERFGRAFEAGELRIKTIDLGEGEIVLAPPDELTDLLRAARRLGVL